MAAWVCVECTTIYAVGAPRCPECGSTEHVEQGEPMPKISRHGGPTNAAAIPAPAVEGSGDVSAGSSSEASSEREPASPKKSAAVRRKPARKTESRSPQDQTDDSSVPGMAGGPAEGSSETA